MISPAGVLAMAIIASAAPADGALPSAEDLFQCPLRVEQADFHPPQHWSTVQAPDLGIAFVVPPGWTQDRRPARFEIVSPDGSVRVSLRRGHRVGKERLNAVRSALEVSELGSSFVHDACAERVTTAVANEAPWNALSFGLYGRPLGERRRRVALYAGLEDGTLVAVVSTRWKRGEAGPDWSTVWQLMGGLRVEVRATGKSIALFDSAHLR